MAVAVETEAMDIADMIVRSIKQSARELWPKLACNLVLTGGVSLTPNMITMIEDMVFQRFQPDVDRVEVLLINVQQ